MGDLQAKYGKSMLTVEEAASELDVESEDIEQLIAEGELDCRKIGSKVRIPVQSVTTFLQYGTSTCQHDSESVTSTDDVTITIAEDDVDMSKGSVTCVKGRGGIPRWIMQLDIGKAANGKRLRESKSFDSEQDARDMLASRLAELNAANGSEQEVSGRSTLHDFMAYYLDLGLMTCTSRTQEGYYFAAGKLADGLGDVPMENLTEERIIGAFNKWKQLYRDSTLSKMRIFLKQVTKYAYKKRYIPENPAEDLKSVKSNIEKLDILPYSTEEVTRLLKEARELPELYPVLALLSCTGMRPEEIRALRWESLDWNQKTIKIDSAIVSERINLEMGNRGKSIEKVGKTKSKSGKRTLRLSDLAVSALQEWQRYIASAEKYDAARDSRFIFPNETGGFLSDNGLRLRFTRFLKRIGLDKQGYTLYRFRHTFCTFLFLQGTPPDKVMRLMGDSTLNVVMRIYNHVKDSDTYRYAEALFESDLMPQLEQSVRNN